MFNKIAFKSVLSQFLKVEKLMELNKLPETASKSGVTGRKEKMMFE